jgi:hypothetical protein
MSRLSLLITCLLFALPALSQELPKKIRGYKVHQDRIVIKTSDVGSTTGESDAVVKIGDPLPTDISLTGVSFELPVEVTAADQSGRVDFLAFHDFRVNGIRVEIEEYRHAFSFRKNESTKLPDPVTIVIPATSLVLAASTEIRDSKTEWSITGRVFVFGRYRKLGFYHKRVVPIDISVRIKNPIHVDRK